MPDLVLPFPLQQLHSATVEIWIADDERTAIKGVCVFDFSETPSIVGRYENGEPLRILITQALADRIKHHPDPAVAKWRLDAPAASHLAPPQSGR